MFAALSEDRRRIEPPIFYLRAIPEIFVFCIAVITVSA